MSQFVYNEETFEDIPATASKSAVNASNCSSLSFRNSWKLVIIAVFMIQRECEKVVLACFVHIRFCGNGIVLVYLAEWDCVIFHKQKATHSYHL